MASLAAVVGASPAGEAKRRERGNRHKRVFGYKMRDRAEKEVKRSGRLGVGVEARPRPPRK